MPRNEVYACPRCDKLLHGSTDGCVRGHVNTHAAPVTAVDLRDVEPLMYRVSALLKERVQAGATLRLPDNVVTRELLENLAVALKAFEEDS